MMYDNYEHINTGDEVEIFHTITLENVDSFVKLTGDNNPLHVNDEYAASTLFRKRVVHGMLTASFISTLIGTKLPGEGALWYEQQLCFLTPVRIGEKIRVWAKVKHKSDAQRILVLETIVFNQNGDRAIEGEAKIKVLKSENKREVSVMSSKEKGAIIITGASRGIGAAIAKELAGSGYPVVVNYAHSETEAQNVVQEIRANQGQATAFRADVTDKQAVQEMIAYTSTEFNFISGVVNNASGSIVTTAFSELSWDEIQKHIDIQVKGTFHLCQTILPHLLARKNGVIVNIASTVVDNLPPLKLTPYSIAKAALVTFSKSLAVEYGPKEIRVNCVSPGMTQTDLIANLPEKAKMVEKMQTPLRRLAVPEDIAGTVVFLFSEKATFITGQNIRVCGGITMN